MAMATNKKKIIILCTMVALLIASGYLNWALTNKSTLPPDGGDTAVATYFNSAKAERLTQRNYMMEEYDAIMSSNATEADKQAAATAKMQLIDCMEYELQVETFLFGKAYEAYIVSCTPTSIHVIVCDNDLSAAKASLIKAYILEETNYTLGQIHINPYTV